MLGGLRKMTIVNKRILITGGTGLIGTAIQNQLKSRGEYEVLSPAKSNLDMTNKEQVDKVFSDFRPNIVINLAAKVGGILANKTNPVEFFEDNLIIGLNTYKYSQKYGVKNVINAGAGCGYPLNAKEPLMESDLWNGVPQIESIAYSTAKKLLTIMGDVYEKEYGIVSTTFIPSNVYGPSDNFNLEKAHVVPALIHKLFLATKNPEYKVEVWGDGSAKRDFIFVNDVATGMLSAIDAKKSSVINIATGQQCTIRNLVNQIALAFNYNGKIIWNTDKPSGANSRNMNTEKIKNLIPDWNPTSLQQGIAHTVSWFSENYESASTRK
jgi:GDP-L-fucose synthase